MREEDSHREKRQRENATNTARHRHREGALPGLGPVNEELHALTSVTSPSSSAH